MGPRWFLESATQEREDDLALELLCAVTVTLWSVLTDVQTTSIRKTSFLSLIHVVNHSATVPSVCRYLLAEEEYISYTKHFLAMCQVCSEK